MKLSKMPTCSTPNVSAQIATRVSSVGVRGKAYGLEIADLAVDPGVMFFFLERFPEVGGFIAARRRVYPESGGREHTTALNV